MGGKIIAWATCFLLNVGLSGATSFGQQTPPGASFRAGVDLVRVAAVVRDHKGHFVPDLTARDFEVVDDGYKRSISDLQADVAGVSVAVLFDVSGSMEGRLPYAREAAPPVLSWLDTARD